MRNSDAKISDINLIKPKKLLSNKILPGDWICNQCQLNNFAARSKCINCGASHAGALRPIDRIGDWTCPNDTCRFHNFANRRECHRCNTRKPIKNRIKAGDWICSKPTCFALNFAKRDACFHCGTIPVVLSKDAESDSLEMDYSQSLFSSKNPFSPY